MITASHIIIKSFLTTWSPLWLICGKTSLSVLSASDIKRDYFNLSRCSTSNQTSKYFYYYLIMNSRKKFNNGGVQMFGLCLSGRSDPVKPLTDFVRRSNLQQRFRRQTVKLTFIMTSVSVLWPLWRHHHRQDSSHLSDTSDSGSSGSLLLMNWSRAKSNANFHRVELQFSLTGLALLGFQNKSLFS